MFDVSAAAVLRSTSKPFHAAATQQLLRFKWFATDACLPQNIERAISLCNVDGPSQRDFSHLKCLKIIPLRNVEARIHLGEPMRDLSIEQTDEVIASNLRELVGKLFQVERLEAEFPIGTHLKFPMWNNGRPMIPTQFWLESLQAMLDSIVHCLKAPALACLRDLRLFLPCTHDFKHVSNSLPDTFFNQLRHLFLGVADETGPGGNRRRLQWSSTRGDYGDHSLSPSNLQKKYHNDQYDGELFNIVARCHNIESLGIAGTHYLDLDKLEWSPAAGGVRLLYMERLRCSPESMLRLLRPNGAITHSSAAAIIDLRDVCLKTGRWAEIFSHLYEHCPNMEYLRSENLCYVPNHPAREGCHRPFEDSNEIWTQDMDDNRELQKLVWQLVDRAGGRENYSNAIFEQTILDEDFDTMYNFDDNAEEG